MTRHLLDTDEIYGQDAWPGRIVKRDAWLLVELPIKWIGLPALLYGFPLFAGMVPALLIDTPLIHAAFVVYWLALWLLALAVIRNYRIVNYYDRQTRSFHEDVYLFGKRLRARSWPRTDFSGVSYGAQGGTGKGFYLSIRLHGQHQGQMLLSFLGADTRAAMITLATTLARLSDLPLLPEQTTGPQHRFDDMRLSKRWVHVARSV